MIDLRKYFPSIKSIDMLKNGDVEIVFDDGNKLVYNIKKEMLKHAHAVCESNHGPCEWCEVKEECKPYQVTKEGLK